MDLPLSASRFGIEVDACRVAVSDVLGLAIAPGEKPVATVTLRRAAGTDRTLLEWGLEPDAKPVVVSLLGPRGDPVVSYVLEGARPVAWHGPELSATSTEIAMEELVLSVERITLR